MSTPNDTRLLSGGIPPDVSDELVEGGDPYECPACVADGVECDFHRGWAAGWDACAALVAQAVEDQRRGADAGPGCLLCGGHAVVPCVECDGTGDERGAWSAIDPCAACDGSGDEPCPECGGSATCAASESRDEACPRCDYPTTYVDRDPSTGRVEAEGCSHCGWWQYRARVIDDHQEAGR